MTHFEYNAVKKDNKLRYLFIIYDIVTSLINNYRPDNLPICKMCYLFFVNTCK